MVDFSKLSNCTKCDFDFDKNDEKAENVSTFSLFYFSVFSINNFKRAMKSTSVL